jgi:hypothetical protein
VAQAATQVESASTATPVVLVVTNTPEPTLEPVDTDVPLAATEIPVVVEPTDSPQPQPTDTLPPAPTDAPLPEPSDTPLPTESPPTAAVTDTPRPPDTPTSPPAPAASGKIAVSVGNALHVFDAATGQTLFTVPGMRQPDLRADGNEILADGQNNPAAVVNINANTGAILREQTSFTDDFHPFWSPDGTRFAFDSLHHGLGNYTMLYTQGLTGGRPQNEMTLAYSGQQIRGHSPVWMHDDWIAFTGCDYWPEATGGSRCGIYRLPSWGGRPAMVHGGSTDMRATDNYGANLLFMSAESGNWEVYLTANQGGDARNLSNSPASNDGLGTFSPDGKLVAFASNRDGGWAVWIVRPDGAAASRLFGLPGSPTQPWQNESMSWGP